MEVGGKKDISGIPSYGTIAIGQADRRTRSHRQAGRRRGRDSQLSARAGRMAHKGTRFFSKVPRALPWNAYHSLSSAAKKSRFPLGSLLVVAGNEEERERERERTQTKREMGGWMDGLAVLSIRAPKESTRQTFFASTLPVIAPKATNAMPMLWAGLEAIVGRDADERDMHLDHDRRLLWGEQERE